MKTEDKVISTPGGDFKFSTTQLPAVRGFKLFGRLVKQIGPLFGAFTSLGDFNLGTDISGAMPAISAALASMDPDELLSLAKECLSSTTVHVPDATGGRVMPLSTDENINLVFSGRLRMMVEVLVFVVRVNFADFLQGGLTAPAKTPTKTPLGTTTLTAG